jgi:hypothetical protein
MDVDETRTNDQAGRVDDFTFAGWLIANFSIDEEEIGDLVAIVSRIDDTAVADDDGTHGVAIPPQR